MSNPTDTLFANQWYLGADRITWGSGNNIWDDYGYTGRGVTVGVFDNGVDATQTDLDANYDANLSLGYGTRAADHGTAVAGIIAAERNGSGVVGIAYDATIGSVPVWGGSTDFTDLGYRNAAFARASDFDVVSQSWGQVSFGDPQHAAHRQAVFDGMESGALYGREGLGTVFVTAAGNNRSSDQGFSTHNSTTNYAAPAGDANAAGPAVESRYSINVAGIGKTGFVSDYSTPGANVLVSAGAQMNWKSDDGSSIWTTDRPGTAGWSTTDNVSTVGTSFAAPQVSGIVALMLQANPNLGYRDVQEILAITATHTGSAMGSAPTGFEKTAWAYNHADNWNGGGMHFSNDYGFGAVDARAAVLMAETWTAQQHSHNEAGASSMTFTSSPWTVPDNNASGLTLQLDMSNNVDLEQVTLDLGIKHGWVGDLVITLTSPSGTTSTLLNRAGSNNDVDGWTFNSNAFRGENSGGLWTVKIVDAAGGDVGTVSGASLTVHGAAESANGSYFFTNEFSDALQLGNDAARNHVDGGAGIDTINLAAITSAGNMIDLNAGARSWIMDKSVYFSNMENVVGGELADTMFGNSSDNGLRGGRGDDHLYGMNGNDILQGDRGNDIMDGGEGNDVLVTSFYGNDQATGGAGIDEVRWDGDAGQAADLGGNSRVYFIVNGQFTGSCDLSGIENLTGGNGGDRLGGDTGANTLVGRGGNDTLNGGDGNDILWGGFKSRDDARGSDGNDTVNGGAGKDLIYASYGNDTIDGGDGSDTLSFAWTKSGITADLTAGSMTGSDGGGYSTLTGFGGWGGQNIHATFTSIENLTGGDGADTLSGDAGANVLDGRGGADVLTGRGGNDTYIVDHSGDRVVEDANGGSDAVKASVSYTLTANVERLSLTGKGAIDATGNGLANAIVGNTGDNHIDGLDGRDVLTGYGGHDTFVFSTALGANNVDSITDFDGANDLIGLKQSVFQALQFSADGTLLASQFKDITAGGKYDADDHIIYNATKGALYYDADGYGGTAKAVQFAVLDTHTALTFQDFHLA